MDPWTHQLIFAVQHQERIDAAARARRASQVRQNRRIRRPAAAAQPRLGWLTRTRAWPSPAISPCHPCHNTL